MGVDIAANERAARLDRAIELKAFELECAEALADQFLGRSDRAWLLSIFEGTLGTTLAVANGRTSNDWSGQASALKEELDVLKLERRLLELQGARARAQK